MMRQLLAGVVLAGLLSGCAAVSAMSLAQLVERERRRAPNPQGHRVFRPRRMPTRYKREPLGRIERDPLARAVVLSWMPSACRRCGNPVLHDHGLEVSCLLCGEVEMVRR